MPGILVRMPVSQVAALDAYIAAQPDPMPSRPEAIRKLLQKALAAEAPPTPAAIDSRIEALEAKVASIPDHDGEPSPAAAMNTMTKALAEAELTGLRTKRKRVKKT